MITIYAEKPDVGNKIAAALGAIKLKDGTEVTFKSLKAKEKAVKSQQYRDGYLKILYMGQECYVTWGYGHLCELKQEVDYNSDYKQWRNLPSPFIPSNYGIKVKEEAKKQFYLVKKLFDSSSMVINATDDDREGELIFYYLKEAAGYRGAYKRVHLSSQTEEGFKEAFAHLIEAKDTVNMTNAGRARSIADWVVGANITVRMSLKYPGAGVLSVGRVQTPTLNLLVERELAIRNFKAEPYYTISAVFKTDKGEEFKGIHKKKSFKDKTEAEEILRKIIGRTGRIDDVKKTEQKKDVPDLYNLSVLQMEANGRFGFTLAKTLEIAQKLYESGFTTYPRTDSQFLTDDMEPTVNNVLNVLCRNKAYEKLISGRPRNFNKRHFDSSKVTSHFAIIPTGKVPEGLSDDEEKIYDLIARSVIMLLYGPAVLNKTDVLINVNGEQFGASGVSVADPGWMAVGSPAKEKFIPAMSVGETLRGEYVMNSKMTEPPKRYTDKTILAAMLSAGKNLDDAELKKIMVAGEKGIGTEATRASILQTLVDRGYAVREKNNISATDKGINLIAALPIKTIKSAELTAKWEKRLNDIAEGKEDFETLVKNIENETRDWCKEIDNEEAKASFAGKNETEYKCPLCGEAVVKHSWGYGCSGYKDGCKFSISNTLAGKKLTDKQIDTLLSGKKTGVIKNFKSKTGKTFDAAIELTEEGKIKFVFDEKKSSGAKPESSGLMCPVCGNSLNHFGWGYGCSGYKDGCRFSISSKIAGREITEAEIKELLKNGKTKKLSGFTGKSGKPFEASLILDEFNKISFSFD